MTRTPARPLVPRARRILALTLVLFAAAASATAGIRIEVDDRFPARVFETFDAESLESVDLDAIVGLPGAQALIRKVQGYAPAADAELLKESLRRAWTGEVWNDDPFYLWHSHRQREKTRALLAEISSADGLSARVARQLEPYLPEDFDLDTRIVVVLGGASAGWTMGDGAFQIGLDHHADDSLALVEMSAAHEVYHVVQEKLLPPPPEGEGADARVDALLRALAMEGTASLLDRVSGLEGDGELLSTLREKQERNRARLDTAYVLLETLVLRTARDPDADLSALYQIGFLDSWGSSSYEVGRSMAEAIVAADGSRAIPRLLNEGPAAFVGRYIELSRADDTLQRFSTSFERLVVGDEADAPSRISRADQ